MKLTIRKLPDDGTGFVDFVVTGFPDQIFTAFEDAHTKYGENFVSCDMNVLNALRGQKRRLETPCRFFNADEALMFRLSLLTE